MPVQNTKKKRETVPVPVPVPEESRATADSLVARANEQIAKLREEIAEIDKKTSESKASLEALAQQKTEKELALSAKRALLRERQFSLDSSEGYLKIVAGTASGKEDEAVRAVRKCTEERDQAAQEVKQAELDLSIVSNECAKAERDLQSDINGLGDQREALLRDIQVIEAGVKVAVTGQGRERHEKYLQAYQEARKRIDALTEQVTVAKSELHAVFEAAIEDLAAWPEYQADMAKRETPVDETTTLIEDIIWYIESLMIIFPRINGMPPAVRQLGRNLSYDLLTVRPDQLLACQRGEFSVLVHQTQRLKDTLQTYRAWLVQQRLSHQQP